MRYLIKYIPIARCASFLLLANQLEDYARRRNTFAEVNVVMHIFLSIIFLNKVTFTMPCSRLWRWNPSQSDRVFMNKADVWGLVHYCACCRTNHAVKRRNWAKQANAKNWNDGYRPVARTGCEVCSYPRQVCHGSSKRLLRWSNRAESHHKIFQDLRQDVQADLIPSRQHREVQQYGTVSGKMQLCILSRNMLSDRIWAKRSIVAWWH